MDSEHTQLRPGRAPATTRGELSQLSLGLFLERGFDETTIDDIVKAAGIGRRTFFRYFSTKNELPWGEFDALLNELQAKLHAVPSDVPLLQALREAIIDFNTFPDAEIAFHRGRMQLIFEVPQLNAFSTLKYASWRNVVAAYVAERRGETPEDFAPQTIAWACLGMCLGSYERWLADPAADLRELLATSFDTAETVFGFHES